MKSLFALIVLAVCVPCRFTVRDVGFVDLGDARYKLHVFVSGEESPAAEATLQRLCKAQLLDVNTEVEFVDPDAEDQVPAHRFLRELQIQEFPAMVLVHPEGQTMKLGFEGAFDEVATLVVESVASSPLRNRIRDAVLRRYAVVLLVEGPDAAENRRAERATRQAFKIIERGFDAMPKAVGDLPCLMIVKAEDRNRERVLIWSLGIEPEPENASVAVLFGRGRRIGPVLDGSDISKDAVLAILATAGESCECDLNRSWMRGPRVPLRWDDEVKQQATKLLGFDPENPLVKSEMSGILSKRPKGTRGATDGTPSVAELLAGYSEAPVEDSPVDPDSGSRTAPTPDPARKPDLAGLEADGDLLVPIFATAGGLLVLSLLVAGFLFLRRPRR